MIIKRNIQLSGKHQKPILTDLFYIENNQPKPIVIFAHGYKGFKDWGCWDLVAEHFANNGIFFIKFNFSHNGGTVNQPIDFPDLEAFGQNNFIKELDDLASVIDWVLADNYYKNEVDISNITLIGHSRGGGIVTIKASEDTRISKVITWAGVSDYGARFPKGEILDLWKKHGVSYIENSRTKQQMPHYYQFYENFVANKDRLYIKTAVKNLKIPYLIIHGTDDETVLLNEAKNLHSWCKTSQLHVVENANHTFGGKHPWEENKLPHHLFEIVERSNVFVKS
ncbi:prolyl oligopeptidase family serine peptidase [Aureibaculum sp. 2210JD6-5]|uniref:alpha/beta hydrolase family protein n=1 Tax=Aureibaculum sp. 2210JD6-5 TaxID=3103957 RepID=UPI002AACB9D3|nr:alpha/beta fold hydrolase [Aureibaculum sp. 2210JD6-5]MDY7394782.1 prolyl oligopeptidase family serine peptidase [Aureibaculum sp. 2210JD6-5]